MFFKQEVCKIKLTILSDTHGYYPKSLPPGDILVHCGDITARGTEQQHWEFIKWFSSQPHKHKLFIAGNHCLYLESCYIDEVESIIHYNRGTATYLRDSSVVIDGIKFHGTPWTPEFGNWAFMYKHKSIGHEHFNKIPEDTDVLISHGPPYGILDYCANGKVGSKELVYHINRVKPKLVLFGHIHPANGRVDKDGITYINAAFCTDTYEPLNPIQTVELDNITRKVV